MEKERCIKGKRKLVVMIGREGLEISRKADHHSRIGIIKQGAT